MHESDAIIHAHFLGEHSNSYDMVLEVRLTGNSDGMSRGAQSSMLLRYLQCSRRAAFQHDLPKWKAQTRAQRPDRTLVA